MSEHGTEVAVVGAGAVGLAAAIAFAKAGFATRLLGPAAGRTDGRTAALLDPSLAMMDDLGAGPGLRRVSEPLRVLRIVDDTGSLFRPPPVEFSSAELGLDRFAQNVENAALTALLEEVAAAVPLLSRDTRSVLGLAGPELDRLQLADGAEIRAALVVAADGRDSRLRKVAGIPVRSSTYPQVALTTILSHAREHRGVSTEFHTRGGPFTLVPLPGRRSSVVRVVRSDEHERLAGLPDAALAREIERESHGILGGVSIDGPRGLVPLGLVAADRLHEGRVALVGEAAHALPPIGAQGLNLGLADVAALVDAAKAARSAGRDIGSAGVLAGYAHARASDIALRMRAVDGLNRALLSGSFGLDAARGLGLGALARIGPLRRAVMRAGLMSGAAGISGRRGSAASSRSRGAG